VGQIRLIELDPGNHTSTALSVQTRSSRGDQNTLLVFSAGGRISRMELHESQHERYYMADLTGNGVVDVMVSRRVPEAGRGYETFLELYVLRAGAYESAAAFPVVRELREFLESAASDMMAGRWDALAGRTATGDESGAPALGELFIGVPGEDGQRAFPFDHAESGNPVATVMLPVLVENPFPFPYAGTRFSLLFRVEPQSGPARLYSATVGLAANPFEEPRFSFLTPDDPQQ
jgi:hypothetical protein